MHDLPSGWRRVTLQEITEEQVEKVGRRRQITVLSSTKHYGLVPSNEYFKGRTIYSKDLATYTVVRRGWFAYATNHLAEGSIGLQKDFDIACVSPIYTVFSCAEGVHPSYMFRVLKSPDLLAAYGAHEQASVNRRGAVRYRDFGKIEINLPPEREQRRIAEILDAVDTRIEKQSALISKLRVATTALMDERLLQAVSNTETILPLEILADVTSGVTLGTETGGSIEIPYLRVANVQDGYIDTSEMKTVRVSRADARRYSLESGDVLLTEGGDFDKLGRGAVWDGRIDPCICQNHVFRVRCDRSRLLPGYLSSYVASREGKRYFLSIAKQTTNLATVSSSQLKRMPIPIPSLEVQSQLVAIARASTERMSRESAQLNNLESIKRGLRDDLLTGRVRVADAEAVLEAL